MKMISFCVFWAAIVFLIIQIGLFNRGMKRGNIEAVADSVKNMLVTALTIFWSAFCFFCIE